jgi:sugar phosphate isomerase/epimerase
MNIRETTISRRTLLRRSAAVAAFSATAAQFGPLLAGPPSRSFKIRAPDWSLRKRCDKGAFEVAKTIGLDGVQVEMCTSADKHLRNPEVQQEYLQLAKETGVKIASLALGELNSVPLKSNPLATQWLNESVDVCNALGVPIVLVAFFSAGELDMQRTGEIDHVVRALKQVAPKAKEHGVILGLENYLSAEDNMRILDRVNSPAVKVYYDVGNSTDKARDVVKEIRKLGDRICEFHAKDANYMLGHGRIDFKAVRQAMDSFNYSGWIQIEAAAPHELIADFKTNLKYLKGIFPAQG